MDHIRDLHESWEVLATLGDKIESLEFACLLTGGRLRVFSPRQYFSFRRRGMRRRAIRSELMTPGYLFVQGDVSLALSSRLTRMRSIGTVTGLEVAHMWEQERKSHETAADEVRISRNRKAAMMRPFRPGERVWCAKGLFRGMSFTVQAQRDREVRLASDRPLFMGVDEVVLDCGFLSREEVKV